MLSGYLKRISNMRTTIREFADDTVDVLVVFWSYKQSHIEGKFHMRAHFREALVSGQDSTCGGWRKFRAAQSALAAGVAGQHECPGSRKTCG
jgi:hypothetical protein